MGEHMEAALDRARSQPGFLERLQVRLEHDKPILDRLREMEHAEANQLVEATMVEIRRLAIHEHRYPAENTQGFSVDQCLDCGWWRS